MKIFIRADGGSEIGLGHIMRMLVLAKELSKSNEVIFLCRTSYEDENKFKAGIIKVKESGFEVIKIQERNFVKNIIDVQKIYKADLIITDSYDVNEEYFNELKPYFRVTGYVDDLNINKMYVDFIINQNINAEKMNYSVNVNSNTKLFLGSKYCMLRDEFRNSYKKKEIREDVEDILLTLGGMDNEYNTLKIIDVIKSCNKNIHVVIGSAFDKILIKKIYDLCDIYSNIKAYENASMSSLMIKCDIAISACGSTLYELCSMSIPTIGIIIADNQKLIAKKMQEDMLVLRALYMNEVNEKNIMNLLNELLNNKELRKKMISKQNSLVNLNGVEKLVYEINKFS